MKFVKNFEVKRIIFWVDDDVNGVKKLLNIYFKLRAEILSNTKNDTKKLKHVVPNDNRVVFSFENQNLFHDTAKREMNEVVAN